MIDHKWELAEIAVALNNIALAIKNASRKEPVFVFLPSDARPEQVKEIAEELRKVLR